MLRRCIVRGILCMFLSLSIITSGYCLFKENIDANQVGAQIRLQREKNSQRRQEHEDKKEEEKLQSSRKQEPATSSSQKSKEMPKAITSDELVELKAKGKTPTEFKRLPREPEVEIIRRQQQKAQSQPDGVKQEEKSKGINFGVLILLGVIIGGVWFLIDKKMNK
ncbi:MAG: hypothetical protein GY853_10795 [PVC group bacterium]|nr:hypothetical protein [PVC group bacterium]